MLKHEIEPFADKHIKNNETVLAELEDLVAVLRPNLTESQMKVLHDTTLALSMNANALTRFKICMVDEWNQKERYGQIARECRLNHG